MTPQNIDRVRAQLKDALDGVQAELARCKSGETAVDTEERLKWMASGLVAMLLGLNNSKADRPEAPGLWYPVTDTWPLNHVLGDKIIAAEGAYKRLR
jgi:hypothetical protein